jgi:hypothetical protein
MTSSEKILQKRLVTSGLSASEWDQVSAGLKDRAFWSARVEKVRYLQTAQNRLGDLLANANNSDGALTSRAQIVSNLMRTAKEEGIATGAGGLTDPGSAKRASVIVDTNAGLAQGYIQYVDSNTKGGRLAFPAWKLVRVSPRIHKRDWFAIWTENGGETPGGQMIALKDDPIWTNISRFGTPYPPFDYGSGMGVEEVSFEECVTLGLVEPDYIPPDPGPVENFNAHLEEQISFQGTDDPGWQFLQDAFGDQIKYADGKIQWQSNIILDALRNTPAGDRTAIRLGVLTDSAAQKASAAKVSLPSYRLTTDTGTIRHALSDHGIATETRKDQFAITESDVSLLPHLWRDPDAVFQDGDGICFSKTLSDGELRMIVQEKSGQIVPKTIYKKK